jgi:hypothetical protein
MFNFSPFDFRHPGNVSPPNFCSCLIYQAQSCAKSTIKIELFFNILLPFAALLQICPLGKNKLGNYTFKQPPKKLKIPFERRKLYAAHHTSHLK